MARQIIKQPNGKFLIFSTVVDNILAYDLDEFELIEEMLEETKLKVEAEVKRVIAELDAGGVPYNQFTLSFHEMLATIGNVHGQEEAENVKKLTS